MLETPSVPTKKGLSRGWLIAIGAWVALIAVLVSVLVIASQRSILPAGWHNVTPHAATSQTAYAINTDTPGLALACVTTYSSSSRDPNQRSLWRTREERRRWVTARPY